MERVDALGRRLSASEVFPPLQRRVVVAVENGPLRALLATALRVCAGRVTFAGTFAEGVAACREPFDALIVDLDLPVGDGLGLLFQLEKESPWLLSRVIGLSSSVESYSALRSANIVAAFVSKPFSLAEMTRRVQMCIASRAGSNA